MDEKVEQLYDQWKGAYLTERHNFPNQMYISYNQDHSSKPNNAVSVSEGQGYGMLITAFMAGYDADAQTNFDNLFRYYQAFPSVITAPLMGWQQVELPNGDIVPNPKGGDDSATDGDLDIAFALLLAHEQWGSNSDIDYLSHAREMMNGILAGDVNFQNPVKFNLKLGDWVEDDDDHFGTGTRPSDFMLNHLRNFSAASGDPAWNSVLDKTYFIINQLFTNHSPQTGLLPDFAQYKGSTLGYVPADEDFLENPEDGYYNWNACRTPWRIATDYILTGDPRALDQLTRLNEWIQLKTGSDPSLIKAGYTLDGESFPDIDYGGLAFSTPFAVSAMINADNQSWLNKLWEFTSKAPSSNYFNNSVRLLSLIVVSGNWWTPQNLPAKKNKSTFPWNLLQKGVKKRSLFG